MADGLMILPHLSSQKEQTRCRLGLRKHFHLSYWGRLKINKKNTVQKFQNIQHINYKANIPKLEISRDTNFSPPVERSFNKILQVAK